MKKLTLAIMLFASATAIAQQQVDAYLLRTVNIKKPVLTDTVNALGAKYQTADLLKNSIETTFEKGEVTTIKADEKGEVLLSKATKDNAIHLLGFNAYADRYTAATLTFKTNTLIEVYIDGAKVESLYKNDSIAYVTVNHNFEPMHVYNIAVKALAEDKEPTVRCEAKSSNADATITCTTDTKRFYELTNNFIGRRVAGVSISPDGKYILTTYNNRIDTKTISYYKVLSDYKTGKVIAPRLAADVDWMPRTSKLYYSEKNVKGYDVYTIDPVSLQEEKIIAGIEEGSFIWSPAEDYLIITVNESAKANHGPLKYHASQNDRVNGRGRTLLAKYNIATGLTERITFGNVSSYLNDITADGKKMLFSTLVTDYSHREAARVALYEVDMETFAIDTILENQWYLNQAAYAPNGKDLLLMAGPAAFDNVGLNAGDHKIPNNFDVQAFLMNRESGKIRSISKDFNPSLSILTWNGATNSIYFKAEEGMYVNVYKYDVAKATWTKMNTEENIVRSFAVDEKGINMVYHGIGMENSSRAYTLSKGKSKMYADPMNETFSNINFGKVEDFNFNTEDGTTIEGFVCFPPNHDENKKYPMIVYYYGGTSPSQKWTEFYYSAHLLASRGYMVYVVNPSGTTGYGQEFSARHVNAWGKRTADEIIEGTKLVCKKYPSVNAERLGCIGASYGGFMTQYLLTQTDIFAGAVSHAGISNLASYWGEGFWGVAYNYVAAADSYPWNNAKLFNEQGSLFNADKINTPILLMHGSEDTNVPVGESIQLYNALKRLNKTVEFIEIEGEDHTIVKSLDKQILWHKAIMAWFAKTLQDNSAWWDAQYPKIYTE